MASSRLSICCRSPEPLFILGPGATSLLLLAVTSCQVRLLAWPITETRRQGDDGSMIAHHAEQHVILFNCSRVPINQPIDLFISHLWTTWFNHIKQCLLSLESCYTHFLLVFLYDQASWEFLLFSKEKEQKQTKGRASSFWTHSQIKTQSSLARIHFLSSTGFCLCAWGLEALSLVLKISEVSISAAAPRITRLDQVFDCFCCYAVVWEAHQ